MSLTSQQSIRICPWRDGEELDDTLSNLMTSVKLFSIRQDDKEVTATGLQNLYQAIQMVSVWRARCPLELPHAIDTMSHLSELVLRDYYVNVFAATHSNFQDMCELPFRAIGCMELRLAYSAAIIRGVNGLTDAILNPNHSQSVHSLAFKLGLPNWLVNIRHDASHNELPSLACLRSCATTLLEWINTKYYYQMKVNLEEKFNHAVKILRRYEEYAKRSEWVKCNTIISEEFIKVPTDIGYRALLQFLLDGKLYLRSISENWISIRLGSRGAFVPNDNVKFSDENLRKHRQLFTPLLRQVLQNWNGFLTCLVNCLVNRVLGMEPWVFDLKDDRTKVELNRQIQFLTGWIRFFVTDIKVLKLYSVDYAFKDARKLQKSFIQNHIPLRHLLELCEASYYKTGGAASYDLVSIFRNGNVNKNEQDPAKFEVRKKSIINVFQKGEDNQNSFGNDVAPNISLEDLESMLNSSSDSEDEPLESICGMKNDNETENFKDYKSKGTVNETLTVWSLCDTWEACPIGFLPGECHYC